MEHRLDDFFQFLYDEYSAKRVDLRSCTSEKFYELRNEKRERLKSMLGIDKLEGYNHSLKTEDIEEKKFDGYSIAYKSIEILPKLAMPAFVIEPESAVKKTILYSQGHGKGGCQDCFEVREPRAYHKNIPLTLAKRGYRVFMYEPVAFGDFRITDYISDKPSGCFPVSTRLLMYGLTTLGLRIYEVMSLAAYMKEAWYTDTFTAVGISGGATVNTFYSALQASERLMEANVISGYSNMFRTSIMAMDHCIDNYVPGILEIGELPDIIAMGAPKRLFLSGGINDLIYPVDGARESFEIVRSIYKNLGIEQRVVYEAFEGVHEFSEAFIDWLDQEKW